VLTQEGYIQTSTDICIVQRAVNGMLFIPILYVDDVSVLANAEEIEREASFLTKTIQ
jgi:hypothetical protein